MPHHSWWGFLLQKIDELKEKGINQEQILYFNFEDERISEFETEDFQKLLDSFYELYPDSIDKKTYLFFDELQEIENWEKFVRRLSENKKYQIYVTGSSSKLLSKEIATSLRGRALSYNIMPFSFGEYLRGNGIELEKNYQYSSQRYKIKNLFEKYIKDGGYPETFGKDEKEQIMILQDYYKKMFYGDVVERFDIRNMHLLDKLIKNLITNYTGNFSVSKYHNTLKSSGIKVGKETLYEYLSYIEDVNFIYTISMYSDSLKTQQLNPKKIYLVDNGFVKAVSFRISPDIGKLLENIVFIELKRKNFNEIYYHKSQSCECDFLIKEGFEIAEALQVTQSLKNEETRWREINGLVDAMKTYNLKEGLILTYDETDEFEIDGFKIRVKPIWKWLLGN